jgi:hypothetical protein
MISWMFFEAAPIGPGLNFFITIPKKSIIESKTVIILSPISFLVTYIAALTKSSDYLLSPFSVLFRVSLII